MIRLFFAVPVPPRTKQALAKEITEVKTALSDWKVSWDKPENLHLTLIFLGWVPQSKVEDLKEEAADAIKGFKPFEIFTGELVAKDNPLWFEIKKGKEQLFELRQQLGEKLSVKGLSLEKRLYHAHLTIGRIKRKGRSKLPKIEKSFRWKADRVALYQSRLRRTGSVYTELASFPLG